MNKLIFLPIIFLTSCATVVVVNDTDGKYEVDIGYGHFHFGPNPNDGNLD